MKFVSNLLSAVAIASVAALASCSASPAFTYQNVTVSIAAIQTGGGIYTTSTGNPAIVIPPAYANTTASTQSTTEFQANIANANPAPVWSLAPAYPATGSPSTSGIIFNGTGYTIFYNAPPTAPVYTGTQLAAANAATINGVSAPIPQGYVRLIATVPSDPANPSSTAVATFTFAIINNTGPSLGLVPVVTCGLNPPSLIIPHATTYQFIGYCAGALDSSFSYQVNGVVGGSAAFGTISSTGLYTAPATIPMTNPVTVSVVANTNPLVTTSNGNVGTVNATVTIQ